MEAGKTSEERGLLVIRHLRDINDLNNGRDSSIEANQEDAALAIAQEIYADFEQSEASAIFLSVSSKNRALETAELIRQQMKGVVEDVHFFISPDDNLADLDHGEYMLPDDYKIDDFYPSIEKAWQVFSDETFNKENYGYKFGDSMPNPDGTHRYPELAEVFTKSGESHQDISARVYRYILDVHSNKERFKAARVRPYVLTHSLPFAEIRSLVEISNRVENEGFVFHEGDLMKLCWEYYKSGKVDSSHFGQVVGGLSSLIDNDIFIQMIKDELDFIKSQKNEETSHGLITTGGAAKNINYETMLDASKEGMVHEWVLKFLLGSGNNRRLAEKLSENSQFHFGPVDYPIENLVNLIQADENYHEEQSVTDSRLESMLKSMNDGWKPAPLIATNLWVDDLEIADGCHRHMALKKLGVTTYPVIFYFRDQNSLDSFTLELKNKS